MKKKQIAQTSLPQDKAEILLPGYPLDPVGKGTDRNALEEDYLDLEYLVAQKESSADRRVYLYNEKAFEEAVSGNDEDVSGSLWSDQEENLGSAEEGYNDYSFSGEGYQNLK